MKTYRLAETPTSAECDALNIERKIVFSWTSSDMRAGRKMRAVRVGAFRAPRAGEWYLSGSSPAAWRAPNDLTHEFHILRLVVVNRQIHITEVLEG